MELAWSEVALLIIAVAFAVIAFYLVRVAKRMESALERVDSFLNTGEDAIEELKKSITPVLDQMTQLESEANEIALNLKGQLSNIESSVIPLLEELKKTAKAYHDLEKAIEEQILQDVPHLIDDIQNITGDVSSITGEIDKRVKQTQDFFEAAKETGHTLRTVTGIVRSGLSGLAVQVASMAVGLRTSLEFLSDNIAGKGGGKK